MSKICDFAICGLLDLLRRRANARNVSFRISIKLTGFQKTINYYEVDLTCLYNNQINAHALIGQSAEGYCAGKPIEKLLYKGNRPQVSMGYMLINHLGCW